MKRRWPGKAGEEAIQVDRTAWIKLMRCVWHIQDETREFSRNECSRLGERDQPGEVKKKMLSKH